MIKNIKDSIKAAARIIVFSLFSVVAVSIYLTVTARRKNSVRRWWARNCARIINLKTDVRGVPPKAPFFLVSNHLSYVDVISLMSELDCVFVAKSDVANWFGLGTLANVTGTIFINREQKRNIIPTLEKIEKTLSEETGVVVFAEGTSTKGDAVLPFKASLFDHAAKNNLSVHYSTLHYQTPKHEPSANLSVCWWGDMTFPDHFWQLCKLSEIRATITFGESPIQNKDRKKLAKELWKAVNENFVQVV